MKPVLILEDNDEVLKTDLCRPLLIDATGSNCDSQGYAKNHAKWVPVALSVPEYFHGLKVESLRIEGYNFEFIRGQVPDSHKLDMRLYPAKAPDLKKPETKWATANAYTLKARDARH